ncbi:MULTISPECIES: FAD:protein FMN transferase [Parabacteroides]|uniref:FAD:protein FMN transferase n=3 Tax=Parabacteroides goldsteinii TaxID=328812 RepID=A0A0J6CIS2_9BACT|nr:MULTISPECIES: FAD:protein FMN transferase [Parabacteroides]EOS18236.1 thiamine biosynthesis lipoprotein [Parabacteroides goldsteinii dnLKV18]KAI4362072.1 FAD:protein FMN transferase [Parabacteroides sp. ASF519]KMM33090.1 thiamine biosynthesis protein ApbE [Parabacteroides goldsteinii]MBF0766729.1 FAD:protein FMN transferase [Parabacteroides goldsteinii]MBS1321943.1 FAD:protein FMN transferase [Parabacteroides sp.]
MYKKIILAAGLWILMFTACTKQKQYFEESGSVFHTIYHIKYEGSEILTEKIDAEFQKFNLSLNPFNPNSIISKVNRNEAVEADDWFIEVFNKAKEVSDHSEGIFDITCAPLVNLWGFGFSKMDSVTPQMIDSIKQFVGYQKVRLDGRKVVKDDSRILLNCSAIAKGYASDIIARLLEREGIENYMVEIGGEVTMKGVNQNGKCWRIGINKPEDDSTGIKNDIEEVVQLCKKGGVATSGNYRNYYVKDGKKYAHTIDPRTGYPSEQSILSATIVAEDCITADAYATAFMAMGLEKAREAAKNIPGIEYYVIYSDENGKHQIEYSTGMLQYLPNRPIEAMLNE